MSKWISWAGGAGVLALLLGLSIWCKPHAIAFDHLRDAQSRLHALGFHCTSDAKTGTIGTGFLITRGAVQWRDVVTLCKSGTMGPEWKGKVWVTRNSDTWQLRSIPEDADTRVWGDVVAFGDADLLDELDDVLAESHP